jgi:hypothetical protein
MDLSLEHAFKNIQAYRQTRKPRKQKDSIIDVMFYVGADPTEDIRAILDSSRYGLMSVSPSFLSKLNSEFKMNLQVADFQKKYDSTDHISTVGTFTSLVASRDIGNDDVKRMLKKITSATGAIQKSLIHLHPPCTDSCYSGITANCKYILPLAEFGFYKYFQDSARESKTEMIRTLIPFLIAVISFFFPILKSVSALNSTWRSWQVNQEIDRLLDQNKNEIPDRNMRGISQELADSYGNGELSEANYNALVKRLSVHCHDKTNSEEHKTQIQDKKQERKESFEIEHDFSF